MIGCNRLGDYRRLTRTSDERSRVVANREQKGNREKRKPKAEKPKAPSQTATFGQPTITSGKPKSGGKKGS